VTLQQETEDSPALAAVGEQARCCVTEGRAEKEPVVCSGFVGSCEWRCHCSGPERGGGSFSLSLGPGVLCVRDTPPFTNWRCGASHMCSTTHQHGPFVWFSVRAMAREQVGRSGALVAWGAAFPPTLRLSRLSLLFQRSAKLSWITESQLQQQRHSLLQQENPGTQNKIQSKEMLVDSNCSHQSISSLPDFVPIILSRGSTSPSLRKCFLHPPSTRHRAD
jgi:hypothetical protein